MGLTKHLPTIGRVFTPMAMLVFLTYEIVGSQTVTGGWRVAVLIGAGLTSIGVEVVGIMAGHTFEGYWRTGDKVRTAVSFFLLMIYMIAGIVILRHNSALLPIPVIATVVYLVSALAQSLEIEQAKVGTADEARMAFDLEQEALDRQAERENERIKTEAMAQAKIERVRAKAAKVSPETKESGEISTETAVKVEELAGNKLEIYRILRENPELSNTAVAETIGVSRQYVGQVKKELNGALAS